MSKDQNLTVEQKQKIHQLEFLYHEEESSIVLPSDNELFNRVMGLDEEIRKKALKSSVIEGTIGCLILVTGINLLVNLKSAFMAGIIFFCIGAILLAGAYPLYNHLLRKNRKKYAPVVLTITNYLA
ncbi:MAG: hypothetical protein K6G03_10215 [Lachnospiraceae bacterium]|nr:hypothetical protein [Lachnospiraceae bacterium]